MLGGKRQQVGITESSCPFREYSTGSGAQASGKAFVEPAAVVEHHRRDRNTKLPAPLVGGGQQQIGGLLLADLRQVGSRALYEERVDDRRPLWSGECQAAG